MLNPPSCILVVEDEPMIRFCLADYLRECGFQVVEAVDVGEAMALLRSPDVPIDLVFSDVHMPGDLDGFDLEAVMDLRGRLIHRAMDEHLPKAVSL